MTRAKRRKRFRKESVKYKISAGNKEVPVKYLNRVRIGRDTVLLFRLLRQPRNRSN